MRKVGRYVESHHELVPPGLQEPGPVPVAVPHEIHDMALGRRQQKGIGPGGCARPWEGRVARSTGAQSGVLALDRFGEYHEGGVAAVVEGDRDAKLPRFFVGGCGRMGANREVAPRDLGSGRCAAQDKCMQADE